MRAEVGVSDSRTGAFRPSGAVVVGKKFNYLKKSFFGKQ